MKRTLIVVLMAAVIVAGIGGCARAALPAALEQYAPAKLDESGTQHIFHVSKKDPDQRLLISQYQQKLKVYDFDGGGQCIRAVEITIYANEWEAQDKGWAAKQEADSRNEAGFEGAVSLLDNAVIETNTVDFKHFDYDAYLRDIESYALLFPSPAFQTNSYIR